MRIDEMYDEIIRDAVNQAYDAGYRRGYESGHRDGRIEVYCRVSLSGGNAVNDENDADVGE